MSKPEARRHSESGLLVILLSSDQRLVGSLALEVESRCPGVELHVVRSQSTLEDHRSRVQPDGIIIDLDSARVELHASLLASHALSGSPLVILGNITPEAAEAMAPAAGHITCVQRSGEYLQAIGAAVARDQRMACADRRIRETVQHYRDILDASSDGIFVLTAGRFTYVNESFAAAVARPVEELGGEAQLVDLAEPEDRVTIEEQLARIEVSGGRRELFEVRLVQPGGNARRFEIACRSSVVGGRRTVVGVARDVTAVRELQDEIERARQRAAQVERLRALGELAAGVAHDFNNVLETILGRIQHARQKVERGEELAEDLAVVEEAAHNATMTVRRIQDFTRPRGAESWCDVDLAQVARDAASFIRTHIPEGVELQLDLRPTPAIRGNAAELREVLLNLLRNAVDAMEGGGCIQARCFAEDGLAVVEIEDNGSGMQPEVCRRAFEPFFSTKGGSGTGLGLSISHGILRRHDAQIQLESEPGRGTRFRLVFTPVQKVEKAPIAVRKDALTVAVVDDDAAVAELIKDLLEELGHRVEVISNAGDLLAFAAESAVDLLITDLDLPGMSGWQLARSARQIHPDLVVGLVTGWPLDATDAELKSRGVDFVLSKPFSIDALARALERLRG